MIFKMCLENNYPLSFKKEIFKRVKAGNLNEAYYKSVLKWELIKNDVEDINKGDPCGFCDVWGEKMHICFNGVNSGCPVIKKNVVN